MAAIPGSNQPCFATTHWSAVLEASRTDSPGAQHALEELCRLYWYPLYAHARRAGRDPHSAEDTTQAFFERLLRKNYLSIADRRRGKFRWFLLTAFKCFLANEWDHDRAQKRGGGRPSISLDMLSGEHLLGLESPDSLGADLVFDRRWAMTLLETTRTALEREYAERGKSRRFALLEGCLPGERQERTYAKIAVDLDMTETAVKVEVHRMKRRYAELIRSEVSKTVADPAEVDDEIRHLMEMLSRR